MLYIQDRKSPYVYEKNEKAVCYDFSINEYTQLHEHIITNSYQQQLQVTLEALTYNAFTFKIATVAHQYTLDTSLKKQELLIQQLSDFTSSLELAVDTSGTISKVLNYETIKEQWKMALPKLKRQHQGILTHGYLEAVGRKINHEQRFTTDLKQYRLFGILFNELLRIPFDDASIKSRSRTFTNTIHSLPIHITEQLSLAEEDLNTNLLTYKITGELQSIDTETIERINKYFTYYNIGTAPMYIEEYSGYYKINKYTAWTAKAEITCTLSNGRGYRRQLHFLLEDKDYE